MVRASLRAFGATAFVLSSVAAAGAQSLPQSLPQSAAPAGAAQTRCWPDWSEARLVVQRESLATVSHVHDLIQRRKAGDLVRVTLCSEQGRYVYRLMIREPVGRVVNTTVDARDPFAR
jgi:hypothetical protein